MIIQDIDILRKVSEPTYDLEEINNIIVWLWEEFDKHKNIIGLSAPQIGIFKRIAVIKYMEPIILINPEIVGGTTLTRSVESCMSLPNIERAVNRYCFIKYTNVDKTMVETAYGINAFAIQHEIDHMDGILIIDRPAAR